MVNIFLCGVVISETAGNSGGLSISMFFDSSPEPDIRLYNTVYDTSGVALFLYMQEHLFLY